MMQVGSNPALARDLLGADVNFVERMTAIKEKKKRALADLRYRALKDIFGTITMWKKLVKAMSKHKQYNFFTTQAAISEPPLKRQGLNAILHNLLTVPAATTQPAGDHDSAGGSSFHPAGSAPPLSGSAAPTIAGGVFGVPASTVPTSAAMDSAGSHRESGVSLYRFADSSSPSPVLLHHIPIDVLFEATSGWGQSISGHGVVVVDKLPDDEIVDPRVKVETVSDYASSPPRSRRKHIGVRGDDILWDRPVEDFFSSESESDEDMENYSPPLPYGEFKDWEMDGMNMYFRLNPDVIFGFDLGMVVNLLCQSLHSDDVEDFWRTQDEWVVSSWKLYPKSSVHVLDLTNGKTVYMFVDKFYPIRATLLERMLRPAAQFHPHTVGMWLLLGVLFKTVQVAFRESYECLDLFPM
ncbi:hypothetical protein Tco_0304820 [Tanacetum coccineum]